MAKKGLAIGIDLGTTYTCAAVFENGIAKIIPNAKGSNTTPSFVSFTERECLIGDVAKRKMVENPNNTIYDVKRFIGRKFNDNGVKDDTNKFQFEVQDIHNKPMIEVTYKKQKLLYNPEEISAMVLVEMKKAAEDYLDREVEYAVVTVPAYFNNAQRQAAKDAAAIAGLTVEHIINEPTAAALAYGLKDPTGDDRNILIYDLGGGTFDVSIVSIEKGIFQVKSTVGNNRMFTHFAEKFMGEHPTSDVYTCPPAHLRLREKCEQLKIDLSSELIAEIDVNLMTIDYKLTMHRMTFDSINADYFD